MSIDVHYYATDAAGNALPGPFYFRHEPASTNYFLNSDAPATQTISGLPAGDIVVSVVGTGSITLSGDATGTVTEGSPITYAGTGADLTCTVNGSLDYVQVEEGKYPTSPIITEGAAATRYITQLQHPHQDYFNDPEGMVYMEVVFRERDEFTPPAMHLFRTTNVPVYLQGGDLDSLHVRTNDGTNTIGTAPPLLWDAGDLIQLCCRFSTKENTLAIGHRNVTQGAEWIWAETAYDGSFDGTTLIHLFKSMTTMLARCKDLAVYNQYRDAAWIEAKYP